MLPRKLYNFNVVIDGRSMAGVAEELTLPSLERKTESYRGASMLGPVDLDLGLEPLKLEFTLAEFNDDVLRSWGVTDAAGIGVRFLGAARADDSGSAAQAIEIAVRGRWKKVEQGNVKGGELAKMKVEMSLTYYRQTSNGQVLVEIDMISGKEMVGGIDRALAMLQAIGLAS
jgi:uncharacterized protein